jgi:hypothetical protein
MRGATRVYDKLLGKPAFLTPKFERLIDTSWLWRRKNEIMWLLKSSRLFVRMRKCIWKKRKEQNKTNNQIRDKKLRRRIHAAAGNPSAYETTTNKSQESCPNNMCLLTIARKNLRRTWAFWSRKKDDILRRCSHRFGVLRKRKRVQRKTIKSKN